MLAEIILHYACPEELGERVFFARSSRLSVWRETGLAGFRAARRENLSAIAAIYAHSRSRIASAASFARGARSPAGPTQEGQPSSHSHEEISSRVFSISKS